MKNKSRLIFFLSIIFIAVLIFIFYKFFSGNHPSKEKFPVRGIDISHHQGKIDWNKLKSEDITFVFMKATEGGDYKDSAFSDNWKNSIGAGFTVGAYHYYNLCKPGIEQANNFIQTVPKIPNALPPVIDLEFGGHCKKGISRDEIISGIFDFLDTVKNYYHKTPIIYTTHEFYNQYLKNDFANCTIWIRDIFSQPELPGNRHWSFWQFSSMETLNGIDGRVDENVFNGTKVEFEKMLRDTL